MTTSARPLLLQRIMRPARSRSDLDVSAVCMIETMPASPRGFLVRTRCHPAVNSELGRCSAPPALTVGSARQDAAARTRKRIAARRTGGYLNAVIFIELLSSALERLQAGDTSADDRRGDGDWQQASGPAVECEDNDASPRMTCMPLCSGNGEDHCRRPWLPGKIRETHKIWGRFAAQKWKGSSRS
jgi:hypothetical protein